MANTPKAVRRAQTASKSKAGTKAEWWTAKAAGMSPRPSARSQRLSEDDSAAMQTAQYNLAGPVDITYYPTNTINPDDPRTVAAGYDEATGTLRIEWGDGGQAYQYYNVPENVWRTFTTTPSPGRFINSTLNYYPYGPA